MTRQEYSFWRVNLESNECGEPNVLRSSLHKLFEATTDSTYFRTGIDDEATAVVKNMPTITINFLALEWTLEASIIMFEILPNKILDWINPKIHIDRLSCYQGTTVFLKIMLSSS